MRHQIEAAPTSAVKAYKQETRMGGQENCYHASPTSNTLHSKKAADKQIGPAPSTASRHRLPLQQLSSNHQATVPRAAAAKHLQAPPANCQQPVSVQLPSAVYRQPLPSDLSSNCEPPTSHEQSVIGNPAADSSSKHSELQDSLVKRHDKVDLVPHAGHAVGAVLPVSGPTQEPPEQLPAHLTGPVRTVQVSCTQQRRSSSNYPTSCSAAAAAHLPVSPNDSQDMFRPGAAPAAALVARAEAALQRLHAHHPVTHIMMQHKLAAEMIAAPAAGGPALQLQNISTAEATASGPLSCTQKQPVLPHSMRRVVECGDSYFHCSGPDCSLSSTAETAAAGTRSTSTAAPACDAAAVEALCDRSNSRAAEQVQQTLDAMRSKLQSLQAMQLDQRIPLPSVAAALGLAATQQGYTVHTAAPFAVRQQPSNLQRGQQDLQLPTVNFPSLTAPSISRPYITDKTTTSSGGSILDSVTCQPLADQSGDANSRPAHSMPVIARLDKSRVAALAAASALAAGAIEHRPTSAEAPGCNAAHVPGGTRSASDYIGPQPGQDWKHWRAAAGSMMVQQAPPALEAAGAVPKLQAAAMPQFLQQHVAMAKRAAAALLQQAVAGGAETQSSQLQDGNLSNNSSQCSCMSTMVPSKSIGAHLQQHGPAADVGANNSAALQSMMGQQIAASGCSRVGNMQVVAPLHGNMMDAAGTAAVAVAQQQTAFAARVLQRLQAQHASHYQNRTASATRHMAVASTYLGLSEGSSAHAEARARAVNQPAIPAAWKLAKQQAEDSPDAVEASPAQSDDSFHSCLQDTAESERSYLFASHMLRRTPFVGVGDQGYEAKDYDYIEHAKRRLHGEPHALDVFFVRDRRYESERLKQGARKQLIWTGQCQSK